MSHHPIHRNTIIPKTDTKDIKRSGVSNRIIHAGVFHVLFLVKNVFSYDKLFGITRPSRYNTLSQWYAYTDPRNFNHASFHPEVYHWSTSVNLAIISDFCPDGIHARIFKGPNENSHHLINDSCSFPLGSIKTGSMISLELTVNPDGTDGSLTLLYPDNAPLVIAKELFGEYV